MASTPLVIFKASDIFEISALMKLWPFGALSGRLSESRSLYLPASSRLRWLPTSPVAPVMSTVFMLIFLFSFPMLCVDRPFRGPSLHDLGRLRRRLHRLVLDRRQREAGGMRRGDDVLAPRQARRRHLVGRAAHVHGEAGEVPRVERRLDRGLVDQVAARDVDQIRTLLHL